MIYDCFTFFNELDLLEIRLNTLDDVVDRFVIAEATRTFSGKPKELFFEKNRERYAAFADKITYIVVDDLLSEEEIAKDAFNLPWVNENRQRNALIKGLVEAKDDDVIMVSDLDEIPRPEKVLQAQKLAQQGDVVRFVLDVYVYFVNFKDYRNPHWYLGTQMVSLATFKTKRCFEDFHYDRYTVRSECQGRVIQKIRFAKPSVRLPGAGWHMTYLGGIEAVKNKIRSFSHQEALPLLAKVEERLASGENIFGGNRDAFAVPVDETFPKFLREDRNRFDHLFYSASDDYYRRAFLPRLAAYVRGVCYRTCVRLVPGFLVEPLSNLRRRICFR